MTWKPNGYTAGGKPPGYTHHERESAQRVSQLVGGFVGKKSKPKKHPGVWQDKEHPFQRGKPGKDGKRKWYTVWRDPNGKFASKPEEGERAKKMGLPEDKMTRKR